jgi:hypothetical protein
MASSAAALRPEAERGAIVASGIVLLTTFIVMTEARFEGQWANGVHFVIALAGFLLAYTISVLTPPEEGTLAVADDPATPEIDSVRAWPAPRPWHTAVIVSALTLFFFTVGHLAEILGSDSPFEASGTIMWMALLFAFVAFGPANFQWSGIAALAVALALGVAWLAFIDEVFEPEGASTFRWMLLLLVLAYAVFAARFRESRPRHSVHMVNAAAIATITLIVTFLGALAFLVAVGDEGTGAGGAGWGWEVLMLLFSLATIAYAAITRERGPAYLGFIALFLTVGLVGQPSDPDEGSLIGWPIVFLLAALLVLAAGLSGRRTQAAAPAPPTPAAEPRADTYGGPPAGQAPPPSAIPPSGEEETQEMRRPPLDDS